MFDDYTPSPESFASTYLLNRGVDAEWVKYATRDELLAEADRLACDEADDCPF